MDHSDPVEFRDTRTPGTTTQRQPTVIQHRKPVTDWQPCKPKPLVATRDMRRITRSPHSPWGRQDRYLENPNARRPR